MRLVALLLPPLETLSFSPTLTPVHMNEQLDTLLSETRRFPPPEAFAAKAADGALYAAGRDWKNLVDRRGPLTGSTLSRPRWQPPPAAGRSTGSNAAATASTDLVAPGKQAAIIWEGGAGRQAGLTLLGPGAGGRSLRQSAQEARDPRGDRVPSISPWFRRRQSASWPAPHRPVHSVVFAASLQRPC